MSSGDETREEAPEPAGDRDHRGPPRLRGRQQPGHVRGRRPPRPGRQPPPRPRPPGGDDQGPAPVPRGDVRPLRRRRQRLPLRAQGPHRLPRLPPDAPRVGEPGRLAGAAGVLLLAAPQRPARLRHPRPGRHGPPRPGAVRGLQQGRGHLRQARHRPRGLRPRRGAGLRHHQHRLQPGAVRRASSRCAATARPG